MWARPGVFTCAFDTGVPDVMTEGMAFWNSSAYHSYAWRQRCAAHALRHLRTQPYTPRTNDKAERFIQTLLRRWAYAFAYPTSVLSARGRSLAG